MSWPDINTDFDAWQAQMMRFAKRMFIWLTLLQIVSIGFLIREGMWQFITMPFVAIAVQCSGRYTLYLRDRGVI